MSAPWGPHISFHISVLAKPRSIYAYVQCIPKSLPIKVFTNCWKHITGEERNKLCTKSHKSKTYFN